MHKKHRCYAMSKLPRTTQIEYGDIYWGWCWTTPQVIEYVVHCPYCGTKLNKEVKQ